MPLQTKSCDALNCTPLNGICTSAKRQAFTQIHKRAQALVRTIQTIERIISKQRGQVYTKSTRNMRKRRVRRRQTRNNIQFFYIYFCFAFGLSRCVASEQQIVIIRMPLLTITLSIYDYSRAVIVPANDSGMESLGDV